MRHLVECAINKLQRSCPRAVYNSNLLVYIRRTDDSFTRYDYALWMSLHFRSCDVLTKIIRSFANEFPKNRVAARRIVQYENACESNELSMWSDAIGWTAFVKYDALSYFQSSASLFPWRVF